MTLAVAATLALLPFLLVLFTAFAKVSIVLALLRYALGVPQIPSDRVMAIVALAITAFVMLPVAEQVWQILEPWLQSPDGALTENLGAAIEPLRQFAIANASNAEVTRFTQLAAEAHGVIPDANALRVVVPAFLITELHEAFTIGALLFLPFIALDIIVANTLHALGLLTVRPETISLPLKLLLFVFADGWYLLFRGFAMGYA